MERLRNSVHKETHLAELQNGQLSSWSRQRDSQTLTVHLKQFLKVFVKSFLLHISVSDLFLTCPDPDP